MALLFGGALYLMLTRQVDPTAYFLLTLGAIPVVAAGIIIWRRGKVEHVISI
jgi:hypothetical protein